MKTTSYPKEQRKREKTSALVSMRNPASAGQSSTTQIELAALKCNIDLKELERSGPLVGPDWPSPRQSSDIGTNENASEEELLKALQNLVQKGRLLRLPGPLSDNIELALVTSAVGELGLRLSVERLRAFVAEPISILSAGALTANIDRERKKAIIEERNARNERLLKGTLKTTSSRPNPPREDALSFHQNETKEKGPGGPPIQENVAEKEASASNKTEVDLMINNDPYYQSYIRLRFQFNADTKETTRLPRTATLSFTADNLRNYAPSEANQSVSAGISTPGEWPSNTLELMDVSDGRLDLLQTLFPHATNLYEVQRGTDEEGGNRLMLLSFVYNGRP